MKNHFFRPTHLLTVASCLFFSITGRGQVFNDTALARASARASIEYLKREMDQYHKKFDVYKDVSSGGNHFHVYAKIPDGAAPVEMNGSFFAPPAAEHHPGATVIRCEFRKETIYSFGGFYFQNGMLPSGQLSPLPNFGKVPHAGINLKGATQLTFRVKGAKGGEIIDFFMAGVGRDAESGSAYVPYPDSSPRYPPLGSSTQKIPLSTTWQKRSINLSSLDLSYVLGGFAWVANSIDNPKGVVFYLDDIQYEFNDPTTAKRLNEPRFLRSYTTLPVQPDPNDGNRDDDFDLVLRNTAYGYDNALTLLAFLADPTPENLQRARLIGDAFVYAAQHDRSFTDGRIRTAYAAGDIALPPGWTPNNRIATVPVPGFYDEMNQRYLEVESGRIDVGNNAWTMIALMALYKKVHTPAYLDAARKIGQFIQGFRNNTGRYKGYQGGIENPESATPTKLAWASTEHNIDVMAAFTVMYQLTGELQWQDGAQHAKSFVDSMWIPPLNCYRTGTVSPDSLNTQTFQLPLDPQSWSSIASPGKIPVLHQPISCAEQNHGNTHHGFTGFDFNNDKDGLWFEGTAQMGVAYAFANQPQKAFTIRAELRKAQQTAPFGDSFGIVAACHDLLSSGFGFNYYRRLHIGASSWNVFAQLQFNPYYQTLASQVVPGPVPDNPSPFSLTNYPNPFKQVTTIAYSIPEQHHITIRIYNLLGQEIGTLVNGTRQPGKYTVEWSGSNHQAGIYIVRMFADGFTINRKMVLLN